MSAYEEMRGEMRVLGAMFVLSVKPEEREQAQQIVDTFDHLVSSIENLERSEKKLRDLTEGLHSKVDALEAVVSSGAITPAVDVPGWRACCPCGWRGTPARLEVAGSLLEEHRRDCKGSAS